MLPVSASPCLVTHGGCPVVNLLRLRDDTAKLLAEIEMTFRTTLLACMLGATLLNLAGAPARAEDCKEPETGTNEVPIISPPLANVVTGTGRLQFYSAPNERCAMNGVFVIPKDKLISYAQTDDGWTSVMYINPRTGNDVSGWVRSKRLKQTGTMGPRQ